MQSLNRVTIMGNLGRDPEVRTTAGSQQVATMSVALSESWKDQAGQRRERTEWVTVVAWRQQAEVAAKYLRKGSRVYVDGKLQTRTWEDKATGAKRSATEVQAERIMLLDRMERDADQNAQHDGHEEPRRREGQQVAADFDDDLPFD